MHKRINLLCPKQTALQPVSHPAIQVGKTPIERALGIDEQGRTTARRLYIFLELNQSQYARWCRHNITENDFAEENTDYEVLDIKVENPKGGRPTTDYLLTATFAKKLAMSSNSAKGEQAREYFIKVEEQLKKVAIELQGQRIQMEQQVQIAPQIDLNSVLLLTEMQARTRYMMSRSGVIDCARECDALVRHGRRVRFHRAKLDEYFNRMSE